MRADRLAADPGVQAVRDIYEALQIDAEWSTWHDRGFTWWPHRHAQRVWAEPAVEQFGEIAYRVNVETDWGVGSSVGDLIPQMVIGAVARNSSLAGPVVFGDQVRWRSSAVVHEENAAWLVRVLEIAALAQAGNADALPDMLEYFDLAPLVSAHPTRGERSEPDEMLLALSGLPLRDAPVPVDADEIETVASLLEGSGANVVRHADRLEATMPQLLAGEAVRFVLLVDESPTIGAGVRMKLFLPSFPRTTNGVEMLPLDLNRLEAEGPPAAHLLGTWTGATPDEDVPGPWFTCFVPNAVLRPGVLLNLALSMGARANWMQVVFA